MYLSFADAPNFYLQIEANPRSLPSFSLILTRYIVIIQIHSVTINTFDVVIAFEWLVV
jgi:hypothetical protein